jgi:hypothetical protein
VQLRRPAELVDSGSAAQSSTDSTNAPPAQLTNHLAMDAENYVSDKHGRPSKLQDISF